jgi:hypothetical protein
MDDRLLWLMVAIFGAASGIALIAVRRPAARPVGKPPVAAVARTHFAAGGGYVEIGGVVMWASADPALRIRPGQVLNYEPGADGHTVTVAPAGDSAREEDRA